MYIDKIVKILYNIFDNYRQGIFEQFLEYFCLEIERSEIFLTYFHF